MNYSRNTGACLWDPSQHARHLKAAIRELPVVLVYDNSDSMVPLRRVAEFRKGKATSVAAPAPEWLAGAMRH